MSARREEIQKLLDARLLEVWWQTDDGALHRGEAVTRPADGSERHQDAGTTVRVGNENQIIPWSQIVAVESTDGHFHRGFVNAHSELVERLLEAYPGNISKALLSDLRATTEPERSQLRNLAFAVLRRKDAPRRGIALALGAIGDAADALALGDFATDYQDVTGWPQLYALEALRLMNRRDALMQIQRASFQAKSPFTIAAARSRLLFAASQRRVPVWEVEEELVPTCGLSTEGGVELNFGPRQFELELNRHLTPILIETPGWQRIAALPEATPSDDPALVEAARQRWAVVREQLVEALPVQVRRLEEALAQQVRWAPETWAAHIRHHPLLVHLVSRAVWGLYVRRGRRLNQTFRVTADRELWGPDDEPFVMPEGDFTIGLVHPLDLSDDVRNAWGEQLADYEVATMFPQIDRSVYRPERGRDVSVNLEVAVPQYDGVMSLFRQGWTDMGEVLQKVFRKHDVAVQLTNWRDGEHLHLQHMSFRRHLALPREQFDLRDVPAIVYSEAMYEIETLKSPQNTGGWAAVTI